MRNEEFALVEGVLGAPAPLPTMPTGPIHWKAIQHAHSHLPQVFAWASFCAHGVFML